MKTLSFRENISSIKNLFKKYNPEDISVALLTSYLWLPNISSPIQHHFLIAVFISIKEEEFNRTNRISNYQEFKSFLKRLYVLTPSFPSIEDYYPEPDWGEIKYYEKQISYKIFYGCEFENLYDDIYLFEAYYGNYSDKFEESLHRSPKTELLEVFSLQDLIISSIESQKKIPKYYRHTGYKELPPEIFWNDIKKLISQNDFTQYSQLTSHYSCELGQYSFNEDDEEQILSTLTGEFPFFFVFLHINNKYVPILPRRSFCVLLDYWHEKLTDYYSLNQDNRKNHSFHLTLEVCNFIRKRVKQEKFLELVTVLDGSTKSFNELFYAGALVSRDNLFLIYVLPPFSDDKELSTNLEVLTSKINESFNLYKKYRLLYLNFDKKAASFNTKGKKLKPKLLLILSQATTKAMRFRLPSILKGELIFIDQFFGIIDELENTDQLSDFFEYKNELISGAKISPFNSLLDLFCSFKDSNQVLIEGAKEPNYIALDPHWGTSKRYDNLVDFFSKYPFDSRIYSHPRYWEIEDHQENRTLIKARSHRGYALCPKIGTTAFFISSPFEELNFNEGLIANSLMESLEDSLFRFRDALLKLPFFNRFKYTQILFFPSNKFSEKFKIPLNGKLWEIDRGYFQPGLPGLRIIYDHEKLFKELTIRNDRSLQSSLFNMVITLLDSFSPTSHIKEVLEESNKDSSGKIRFKLQAITKIADFPDHLDPFTPEIYHHKYARKRVAELALNIGIVPGKYRKSEAKEILNKMREAMIDEINLKAKVYKYKQALLYCIERENALDYEYEMKRLMAKKMLEQDYDYDVSGRFAKDHDDFIEEHKSYRYLIEKLVQLKPTGKNILDSKSFQHLIALIDKFLEISSVSDTIHHELFSTGIEVLTDYRIIINADKKYDQRKLVYGKEEKEFELGLAGSDSDKVEPSKATDEFLNELNKAFLLDLGFRLSTLYGVLSLLSRWSTYYQKTKEKTTYSSTKEIIVRRSCQFVKELKTNEAEKIIDFLTLKSEDILKVTNQQDLCLDLPIWEHNKRPQRYTIKPLILIDNKYYWGPVSAYKSSAIWSNIPVHNSLPYLMDTPNINRILKEEEKDLNNNLEKKALVIVKRFTRFADRINYTRNTHPQKIGEYDVLAYLPKENILLNIECKDISPAFCLKDTKTLREKIFGKQKTSKKGYLLKVEKREEYLKKHLLNFKNILNWPIDLVNPPQVISLFISRYNYWWTKYPPRKTPVSFMRIDILNNYLTELSNNI